MENLTVRCGLCGHLRAENVTEAELAALLKAVPVCPGCGAPHLQDGVLGELQIKGPEGATMAACCRGCGFPQAWGTSEVDLGDKLKGHPRCSRCGRHHFESGGGPPSPVTVSCDPSTVLAEARAVLDQFDAEVADRPVEQLIQQLASQTGTVGALVLVETAAGVLEESLRYAGHVSKLDQEATEEIVRMSREKGRELSRCFNMMSVELRKKKGPPMPPSTGGQC